MTIKNVLITVLLFFGVSSYAHAYCANNPDGSRLCATNAGVDAFGNTILCTTLNGVPQGCKSYAPAPAPPPTGNYNGPGALRQNTRGEVYQLDGTGTWNRSPAFE